jgi:hypothetical protein
VAVKVNKVDVHKFLKLPKVAPRKRVDARMVYRLILSEETVNGQRRIECTYSDGTRIHGKNSNNPHPLIVVSADDQDEILWVAKFPFEIKLKNGNPFFRSFPAKAVRGRDHLWRVATGPAKATGGRLQQHEFGAFRLLAGSVNRDLDCEYLDPHFIIDP